MKIAIFYCGHVRTLLSTIKNHQENLPNFKECDLYLSLWNCWGHGDVLKEYVYNPGDVVEDNIREEIIDRLNPKFIEFEDYLNIKPEIEELAKLPNKRGVASSTNIMSMFYKIEKAFMSVEGSKIQYDGVLRMRPDLIFLKNIRIPTPATKTLYTSLWPRWNLSDGSGLNDQFFFGNFETMKIATSVYSSIKSMFEINPNLPPSPEFIFKYYLDNNNIKYVDIHNEGDSLIHDLLRG